MRIVVPASTANLGSGFDAIGMALSLTVELGLVDGEIPERAEVASGAHPAATAFAGAGGRGRVWVRGSIPSGRGLGFSGAVRVGAIGLALQQNDGGDVLLTRRDEIFRRAAELEGHGDNVAASTYGGVVVAADAVVARVPIAVDPAVVVWIPSSRTNTAESRAELVPMVSREDAVFNLARTGLLVAALATGDVTLLREATRDRLHQDVRLAKTPRSRLALDRLLASKAWAGWLSGSGPTIAGLCAKDDADEVSASLPEGRSSILTIDRDGARWS